MNLLSNLLSFFVFFLHFPYRFWLGLISFQCSRAWRKSITGAQQSISQYSASPQAGAGGTFYCVLRCVCVIFYASTTRTRETIKPHENCPFLSALTVSAPSLHLPSPTLGLFCWNCKCVVGGDGGVALLGRPIKKATLIEFGLRSKSQKVSAQIHHIALLPSKFLHQQEPQKRREIWPVRRVALKPLKMSAVKDTSGHRRKSWLCIAERALRKDCCREEATAAATATE